MFKRILLSTIILSLTSLLSFSELRGVWLTTNSGLDWPGKSYDESVQKQRMVEILDKLQKAHFNLVLFQVQANGVEQQASAGDEFHHRQRFETALL